MKARGEKIVVLTAHDSTSGTLADAAGVDAVLVPGEPERQRRADRLAKGIAIDETTWGQLCDTARLVGLSEAEVKALTGV